MATMTGSTIKYIMQKGFGLIGILIVVAVIAGIGAFVFESVFPEKSPFTPSEEEKSAIETAEQMKDVLEGKSNEMPQVSGTMEDETANWKTYRNEEYGFEVRYPEKWMIRLASQTFVSPRQISFVIENPENKNEVVQLIVNQDPQISNQGFDKNVSFVNKTLGGISAREYRFPHPGEDVAVPQPGPHTGLWAEKNNQIYVLVFFDVSEIQEMQGIYNQILSTFKFIK